MQSARASQTVVGTIVIGVLVTVLGGIILQYIQKGTPMPYRLYGDLQVPKPPEIPQINLIPTAFSAAVGVTKSQISDCVSRNSNQFVDGRDYGLDDGNITFREIAVRIYTSDQTLYDILRDCSGAPAN